MPIKLKDIALEAGVSLSTASHALNHETKSRISKETADRVRRIATQMGYRPNVIARSLKYQRTDTIAFYTGYGSCDVRDRFLGEIVTGIQQACERCKVDLLLFGKRSAPEVHQILSSGKIDGIVVHASADDPVTELISSSALPAVAIADQQPDMPSIIADDVQGIKLLVELLWRRGHRRLAFLAPDAAFTSVERRQATFVQEAKAHGADPQILHMPWRFEEAVDFLQALLGRSDRPTALCCWHDDVAYFLLQVCMQIGIPIPQEFAVVGFDGLTEGRIPGRRLVTASVPWLQMASQATRCLLRLRDGDDVDAIIRFPVALTDGDTV